MKFSQDELVEFDTGLFSGLGMVCGKAMPEMMKGNVVTVGEIVIVEILESSNLDDYPYSHIALPEAWLKATV